MDSTTRNKRRLQYLGFGILIMKSTFDLCGWTVLKHRHPTPHLPSSQNANFIPKTLSYLKNSLSSINSKFVPVSYLVQGIFPWLSLNFRSKIHNIFPEPPSDFSLLSLSHLLSGFFLSLFSLILFLWFPSVCFPYFPEQSIITPFLYFLV